MATIDGQVVLGLDIPKTTKQINAQIAKLQAQLKKIDIPIDSSPINRINAEIRTLANALKSLDLKSS